MSADDAEPTPPHARLLKFARATFVLYTALVILLYLASIPGYLKHVSAGTVPDISFDVSLSSGNAYFTERAATAGLSLDTWLIANTAASLLVISVTSLISGLIFWRLPQSWFALLSTYVIMLTGMSAVEDAIQAGGLAVILGPWVLLLLSLGALIWPIFPIWLYLFPDGRAVPRWARWPIGVLMGVFLIFFIVFILNSQNLIPPILVQWIVSLNERAEVVLVLVLPAIVLALGSQIYRYWRVSGSAVRQQTKWFLFGLALLALAFVLGDTLPFFRRLEAVNGSVTILIIPICVGISLLRYRLWDVDVIIRRTTSYAILTALLVLLYFGSVVILQRLLSPITGQSTAAIVLSTLLIAALFLPIRRRVQNVIDRRFFRSKYDAEKVLEQFAATLRDETDLDRLTAELLSVIQETMQPEFVDIVLFKRIDDTLPGEQSS